jgi:hypothetical protein
MQVDEFLNKFKFGAINDNGRLQFVEGYTTGTLRFVDRNLSLSSNFLFGFHKK